MTCYDRYNFPLTTTSEEAAQHYREGVDLLLSLWPGAADALEAAITLDPEFALAHAARARLHAINAEIEKARARIALAEALVSRQGTVRERSHVGILALVINGQTGKALDYTLKHIEQWPQDIVIFSLSLGAFGLLAFSGMPDHDQARVDLCDRYARHFENDDWWFLNYRGWAHGENGNLNLGLELSQRSLELRRQNVNAVHAVSHVMHEAGAHEESGRLIAQWLPGYDRAGTLYSHIAWHWALVALERGDTEQALAIYAEHVSPSVSQGVPINVVTDTSAFLWRLQAYGHEVPAGLWDEAATYSSRYFQQPGFPFADVHMALIAAAVGDKTAVEQRAGALAGMVDAGTLPAGPVVPAICRAAQAFADEDFPRCVRLLEPVAHEVVRIGGSGAQREIVEDTLLVALMRSGEASKARAVLDRRLHCRPSLRDTRWRESLTVNGHDTQ